MSQPPPTEPRTLWESEAAGGGARRGRRIWVRIGQLVLTVLVTWFILDRVGVTLGQVAELDLAPFRPDVPQLLLSSLLLLAGYFLSALLWGRLTEELSGVRVSAAASLRIYFTANLGRYLPGKVWQLAGVAYLAGRAGIPVAAATGGAVLGQGLALAGATLVGAAAFLGLEEGPALAGRIAVAIALAVLLLGAVPAFFSTLVDRGFRRLRSPPPEHLRQDSTFGIRWIALYSVNWIVYASAFWILVRSLGVDGPVTVGPAFAAAYVLGYVAVFAPAGIGVREGFLVVLLGPVTGAATALAVAVIARLWTTVIELLPAAAFGLEELRRGFTGVHEREDGEGDE